MHKEKKKIDSLIKESLTAEEAKFYDELEEKNLLGKLGQVHKGKMGWLVTLMTILHVVLVVVFVYIAIQFFDTENTNELIKWGVGGFICWSFMAMMKLYIWMQIDKNDVLRELKRLELQLAVLSEKTA